MIHMFFICRKCCFRGNDKRWPDSSFINIQNLTGVYFPSTMQAIGNSAFDNCTSLEVIVLGPDFNTMYPRMLAGVKILSM